ncbi:MAG: hypothetical protein Q9174_004259 [Haloplaca sp. 1 TL-2023]
MKGYNKTVLTSPTAGVVPFESEASATPLFGSAPSDQSDPIASIPSPSPSPADLTLISGGAIAGAVAGAVLVLAAIVGIVVFFFRRHRLKKEQERQAATMMAERAQQQYVYAEYAKTDGSTLSPPMSPPMHSRHPSDRMAGFPSSPPLSDNDRPWSPETVRNGPVELAGSEEVQSPQKR